MGKANGDALVTYRSRPGRGEKDVLIPRIPSMLILLWKERMLILNMKVRYPTDSSRRWGAAAIVNQRERTDAACRLSCLQGSFH